PVKAQAVMTDAAPAPRMPAWVDDGGQPTEQARVLLRYLEDAPAHGINPAAYGTAALAAKMKGGSISPGQRAQFTRDMTRALVRYAQDMTGPRVDPSVTGGTRREYWRKSLTEPQVRAKILAAGGDLD